MNSTLPSNIERLRRLPFLIGGAIFENIRGALLTGPIMLYCNALQFEKSQSGIVYSLPMFLGLAAIFVAPVISRFGYKPFTFIFYFLRGIFSLGFLLAPWAAAQWGISAAFYLMAICSALIGLTQAFGQAAATAWSYEFYPPAFRARLQSFCWLIGSIFLMIFLTLSGYVLDHIGGIRSYQVIFFAGSIATFIAALFVLGYPGGRKTQQTSQPTHWSDLAGATKDKDFVKFMIAWPVFLFITIGVSAFMPIYWVEYVGLTAGQNMYLGTATWICIILTMYGWGWLADRFGGKTILLVTFLCYTTYPIVWFIAPKHQGSLSFWYAVLTSLYTGVTTWAGLIGADRYFYCQLLPNDQRRNAYSVLYVSLVGTTGALGPIVIGYLLEYLKKIDHLGWHLGQFHIDAFSPLFLVYAIVPVGCWLLMHSARSDSDVRFGTFLKRFVLIPYYAPRLMMIVWRLWLGKTSRQRIKIIRTLKTIPDMWINVEVCSLLADPDPDIKRAAFQLAGLIEPRSNVAQKMLSFVDSSDPLIAALAAWQCGRISQPTEQIIEKLKAKSQDAEPVVRQHSILALSEIQPEGLKDLLLDRWQKETKDFVKKAILKGLTQLHYEPAVQMTFEQLNQTSDLADQMELAYYLAKWIGNSADFIRLVHSFYEDQATALSRGCLKVGKLVKKKEVDFLTEKEFYDCADDFAENRLNEAIDKWCLLIQRAMPLVADNSHCHILTACLSAIKSHRQQRLDYLLLSMHLLLTTLKN